MYAFISMLIHCKHNWKWKTSSVMQQQQLPQAYLTFYAKMISKTNQVKGFQKMQQTLPVLPSSTLQCEDSPEILTAPLHFYDWLPFLSALPYLGYKIHTSVAIQVLFLAQKASIASC